MYNYWISGPNPAPALPSDSQIMSLALYIGQYSAPSLSDTTLTTLANSSATINVYPLVSGGAASDSGFSKTNGANGTVSVAQVGATNTMNYNATYTPTAGYIGSDSFTLSVANPSGSDTRSVSVTVVGITSSGSAEINGITQHLMAQADSVRRDFVDHFQQKRQAVMPEFMTRPRAVRPVEEHIAQKIAIRRCGRRQFTDSAMLAPLF